MNRANLTATEQALVAFIKKNSPREVGTYNPSMWLYLSSSVVLCTAAMFFQVSEPLALAVAVQFFGRLAEDIGSMKRAELWRNVVLKYDAALEAATSQLAQDQP